MKKCKISAAMCAAVLTAAMLGGCGGSGSSGGSGNAENKDKWEKIDTAVQTQESAETYEQENEAQSPEQTADAPAQSTEAASSQENATETAEQAAGFNFADLADVKFEYSSGAGGWSTDMMVYSNGYFRGTYHDSEMGDTGEGYENGSYYYSDFTGHFTDPVKVSDNVYEFDKKDISYRYTPGTEAVIDSMRYMYSEAAGLENTNFRLYLPGTPISELPEDLLIWVESANNAVAGANSDGQGNNTESPDTLVIYVLENVSERTAFASYSGFDRKADVLQQYEYCKNDYDAAMNRFQTEDMTQQAMNIEAQAIYEETDSCLNYIWDEIYYTKDTDTYKQIQAEQQEWMNDRDAQVKEAADQYKGGSLYDYVYAQKMAELTLERCGKLTEYLK